MCPASGHRPEASSNSNNNNNNNQQQHACPLSPHYFKAYESVSGVVKVTRGKPEVAEILAAGLFIQESFGALTIFRDVAKVFCCMLLASEGVSRPDSSICSTC